MPVDRHTQHSLAAGEWDPLLWSRGDIAYFYNAARVIENVVPLPQGGGKRREGWAFRHLQRGKLSQISNADIVSVSTVSGGTGANATDGSASTLLATTISVGTNHNYEIVRVEFPSAKRVSMIDVSGLRIADLPIGIPLESGFMIWEYSNDGATWTTTAGLRVGDIANKRRFANAPNTDLGTAIYWRLVLETPAGSDFETATVELSEVAFFSERGYSAAGADLGEHSQHRITTAIESEYVLVLTDRCCDVFRGTDGEWLASCAIPHTDSQVFSVKGSPALDTMILYHNDQPPFEVKKLRGDTDWGSNALLFDSVTQIAFDDINVSGGVNEKQVINFSDMAAGNKFTIEYNGESSSEITANSTQSITASDIQTAINGMSDISGVIVTVYEGTGASADMQLEFAGADGKKAWPIMVVNVLTGSGTATVEHLVFGQPDKDDLWSETRGYPSCGAFYQGRHWMGGFKARQDIIVGSRAGAIVDFKEDASVIASSPIVVAPNTDDQTTITDIYAGRHLQIFTSSAEIYIPDEPITVDNIALKVTTRHGSSTNIKPVDIQGGTIFLDKSGRALREYLFTDAQQSYSAEPISIMAGHLVASPRSMTLRPARDVDEPVMLLLANTGVDRSGNKVPAAMCVVDRSQEVTGFTRIKTEGTPLSFISTQAGEAFVMVGRELGGVAWNFLEQFDSEHMSDCSVILNGSGNVVDLTDYPWLEGQQLELHGDGIPFGAFTVVGGFIDLGDRSYSASVEAGLRQVPRIVLHSYKGKSETSPTMTNQRVFRCLIQFERTGAAAITAHDGGRPRAISFQSYDSGTSDPTIDELLFTGPRRISGLGKWQKEPVVEITQLEPMPFLMKSISYDVRF